MASLALEPGALPRVAFRMKQTQPETLVELHTDQPPERTQPGDPRPMAFRVINPEVVEVGVRGKRAKGSDHTE